LKEEKNEKQISGRREFRLDGEDLQFVHLGDRRSYDRPQTPFERVLACKQVEPRKLAELGRLRERLDPFELSRAIDRQLERIYTMRCGRVAKPTLAAPTPAPHPWQRSYKGMRRAGSFRA
jgi:hypothetical protein